VSNAMKLLMTTDTIGGVWTYVLDLARALRPRGVSIALATMGAPLSPAQRREVSTVDNITVYESAYKLEWMDNPWSDVAAAGRWLLELEQQIRPDLIHLNGYAHAALPFRAPIIVVAHSCVLSWWQAVKGEAAPAAWNRYRDEVGRGLVAADVVVAPTQAFLSAIEDIYGPLKHKRVVHNGRDSTLYRRAAKESFILAAGRLWDEAKNLSALQHVAGDLSWPICVAGEARSPDGHGDHARNGDVLPLGHLSPEVLADWYARADIYALPARYEPFGLSVLEAALSGCALVLGDVPTLREVWGESAMFVPPDDEHQLRRVLQMLIDDAPLRQNYAGRASLRAALYILPRMGDSYFQLYLQTLRRFTASAVDPALATDSILDVRV
jgi:glycogen synthase